MALASVVLKRKVPRYLEILFPAWFFFAFFTGVKLLPQLANNVGWFEIVGALMIFSFLTVERAWTPAHTHPLIIVVGTMAIVALISQFQIPAGLRTQGLIQVAILAFLLAFLVIVRSLITRYRIPPSWLLQIVVICALVAGAMVVISGIGAQDVGAAGAFRNRAHMASYMLTTFWLCLIAFFWPSIGKWSRLASLSGVILSLYAVAISGRRSVYLSLFLGMLGLMASFLVAQKGRRIQWLAGIGAAIGFMIVLYTLGERLNPQAAFFQSRVEMVDTRLRSFFGVETSPSLVPSFFELQRVGVRRAVSASPILGIGWGGFPKSQYSPTGHEVHSTPLRFLAELGFVGILLYVLFMVFLLRGSMQLFLRMRASPYGNSYLAMTLAIWSLAVSYVYNRHITERTFWILLAIFIAMEVFANDWHTLKANFGASPPPTAEPRPSPTKPSLAGASASLSAPAQ